MTALVLTRKIGEQVELLFGEGTSVLVTVKRIDRNQVRLLFDAPEKIKIERPDRKKIDPQ
tara:strand:- start:598 stop:777 length:180 start_codon:yes stop_codon:yes gene_type:complete